MKNQDSLNLLKGIKPLVEKILNEELPKSAWRSVSITKVLGGYWLSVEFAGADYNINDVKGQRPLSASLRLDGGMELKTQGYGSRRIYFSIDENNPKEKNLALSGSNIPFRTPKKEEAAVLRAIRRFVQNWRKVISDKDAKFYRHSDKVDYDSIVNFKKETPSRLTKPAKKTKATPAKKETPSKPTKPAKKTKATPAKKETPKAPKTGIIDKAFYVGIEAVEGGSIFKGTSLSEICEKLGIKDKYKGVKDKLSFKARRKPKTLIGFYQDYTDPLVVEHNKKTFMLFRY